MDRKLYIVMSVLLLVGVSVAALVCLPGRGKSSMVSERMAPEYYREDENGNVVRLDGENEEVLGIPFVKKKKSYLKIRIQYILEGKLKVSLENKFSQMVCYGIIVLMLIISFVFVPEAYKTTEAENEETFYVSKENAYFIKCDEEYKLYVEGKYMCSLSPIPEEFEEVPIINEEDLK